MKISNIFGRQILDSKGTPTVEVEITLDNGVVALAAVPSGASTGSHEAVELRDEDNLFEGKSVLTAVKNINKIIAPEIINLQSLDQKLVDQKLIDLDGTKNKSKLGANSLLGVSIAVCKAAALSQDISLHLYIGQISNNSKFKIPRPMILMLEGGKHGNFATDIQEFMLMPKDDRFENFTKVMEVNQKIFKNLEKNLSEKGYSTGVGLEGAFCPKELSSNEEAFELLVESIERSGFKPSKDFEIAIDFASSEFFLDGNYILKSEDNKKYTSNEWSEKIISWTNKYPIFSIEDPHQEDLWEEWSSLNQRIGSTHQIVGDDLVTTNPERIKQAIEKKAINSVLIKLNQIGTVTETLEAVALTKEAGWTPIISHRSGETNDDFIADFAVGVDAPQCKFGGLSRGERISKYNKLLKIEEQLN